VNELNACFLGGVSQKVARGEGEDLCHRRRSPEKGIEKDEREWGLGRARRIPKKKRKEKKKEKKRRLIIWWLWVDWVFLAATPDR